MDNKQVNRLLLCCVLAVVFYSASACTPSEYECKSYNGRWTCPHRSKVCDHTKDCHWGDDESNCDVVPDVSFYCSGYGPQDGYYSGRSIECSCNTVQSKKHKGSGTWFQNDQPVDLKGDRLVLTSEVEESGESYNCIGKSGYGAKGPASVLKPKFAYLDDNSVTLSPKVVTLCGPEMTASERMTCRIPRQNVNPRPSFAFYKDGQKLNHDDVVGEDSELEFLSVLEEKGPAGGGKANVSCRVGNSKFEQFKQEVNMEVLFKVPPPHPPSLTILNQTFQGLSPVNVAVVSVNFTGSVTCQVHGGFPEPRLTYFACAENAGFTSGRQGTVRFQNPVVTKSMDGVICSCRAEHESGCYDDAETKVRIKVLFSGSGLTGSDDDDDIYSTCIIERVILAVVIVILIALIALLVFRQRRGEMATQAETVKLQEPQA